MPNHVTNIMRIMGTKKQVKEILTFIEGEEEAIDFEKIIPMPNTVFRGNLGTKEREEHGRNNWYDWSATNWGTKWNAYYASVKNNTVTFDTAWASPLPIFEALSARFPKVIFEVDYADEDIGHNLGSLVFINGEMREEKIILDGTDEAIKFACEVRYRL